LYFHDQAPTTTPYKRTSVRVPLEATEVSIATLQQFSPKAAAMSSDLTEARPLIQIEMTVKTPDGGQPISGIVDCDATLDFV
jgi:hypothetical protein